MQPASRVNRTFAAPIGCGSIAVDRGIDGEVRAESTSRPPTLAVERMSAVSAQQPRVVQREHNGQLPGDPGQHSQVEVAAVQIVRVNDVGPGPRQLEEARCARVAELFQSAQVIQPPDRVGQGAGEASELLMPWLQTRRHPREQPVPRTAGLAVRDDDDVGVVAALPADRQPRIVTTSAVPREEVPGDSFGTAADVSRADLQDPQGTVRKHSMRCTAHRPRSSTSS
jgi:hypothetical protein